MRPTELPSPIPEGQITTDRKTSQAWELFVEKLAAKFQLDFTRVSVPIHVDIPGSAHCLVIQRGDGYVAVAYGARTGYGLLPEIQIVFDASNEVGWTPVEVQYSSELWQEFRYSQGIFTEHNGTNEEYVEFEAFVGYVLEKIKSGFTR
jgi:hypothetical protein